MRPRRIDTAFRTRFAGRLGSLALAGATAVVGACGSSPPTRYHALTAVPAAATTRPAYDGPVLAVGSVQMPPTLSRSELIRDTAAGRFEVREFDHWAAPLPSLARQVLAEDSRRGCRPARSSSRAPPGPRAGAVLEVDVLSFRLGNGVGTMLLSWSLRAQVPAGGTPRPPRGAQLRLETPAESGSPDATVRVWNELIGQLADRVVADLARGAPAP